MVLPSSHATSVAFWGMVIHFVCDWLFQNEWMAKHKSSLLHPSAYVHSGIHFLGLWLLFPSLPWYAISIIACAHLLVDTRIPLLWWSSLLKQTRTGEYAIHVSLWADQVLHLFIIALVTLLCVH